MNGRQPNSATQADGASVGGSYIFHGGFIGAAITQNDTLYRIPGIDGADHQTRIDAHQTKFTAKGEYRPDAAAIDAVRFWAGATDYKHNEIGLADPADLSSLGVRQTFTNKEQEGRVEVQMAPFNARFAAVTTAFGLQAGHQELTAPSPDDPGSPLNGLWDPNKNTKVAGYVFNEFKFTDTTKAQIAGRIEHVSLSGTTPAFIPELFDLNANPGDIGPPVARNLNFTPKSASIGLIQNLPGQLVASITAQYVERAPKARGIVFARRRTTPPAPSTSAIPISASKPPRRSRSDCGGRQDLSGSKQPPTTPNSTASFTAASPATPARMSPVSALPIRLLRSS